MEEKITSETFESNSLRITAIYWVSNRCEVHFRTSLKAMSFSSHQKVNSERNILIKSCFPPKWTALNLRAVFFLTHRWKSVLSVSLCELPCASHNTVSWVWLCSLEESGVGKDCGSMPCRWLCSSGSVLGFSWKWCCPVVKTVAVESVGSQLITSFLLTSSIILSFQPLVDGPHCHYIFHLWTSEGSRRSILLQGLLHTV